MPWGAEPLRRRRGGTRALGLRLLMQPLKCDFSPQRLT